MQVKPVKEVDIWKEGLNKQKKEIIDLYWIVSENMFDLGEGLILLNMGLQSQILSEARLVM